MPRYFERVCYHHFHFFDYPISMTDKAIDINNLYNRDDPDPARTYFSILPYWERNVNKFEKSLKIEVPVTVSINGHIFRDLPAVDASRNLQLSVTWKMKGWGKKKVRKAQRKRPAGWHGARPKQKPIKRWCRDSLADLPIIDSSGILHEVSTSTAV